MKGIAGHDQVGVKLGQPLVVFSRAVVLVDERAALSAEFRDLITDLAIAFFERRLFGRHLRFATLRRVGRIAADEVEVLFLLEQVDDLLGFGQAALGDEQVGERAVGVLL